MQKSTDIMILTYQYKSNIKIQQITLFDRFTEVISCDQLEAKLDRFTK